MGRGGAREGAGCPRTGRRQRNYSVTDAEQEAVKARFQDELGLTVGQALRAYAAGKWTATRTDKSTQETP